MGIWFGLLSIQNYYYIDSTIGIDNVGRNGRPGQEWATLAYAVSRVNAGDTIFLNSGEYVLADNTAIPVGVSLNGAGDTSILKSTTANGRLILYSTPNVVQGNQSISHINFNGSDISVQAIDIRLRSNVSIHHCSFTDFWSGVSFGGTATISEPPTEYYTGNSFSYNTTNNCSIYSGYARGHLTIGCQDGFLCHHNIMTQNTRVDGINGFLIKMNNSMGWNKGLKIYENTMIKNKVTTALSWDFAIELGCAVGLEIYNNTIKGCIDFGSTAARYALFNELFWEDYGYNAWIHHNIMGQDSLSTEANANSQAFDLENTSKHIIIEKNRITNLRYPFHFYAAATDTISDIDIRYNICTGVGRPGRGGSAFLWGNSGLCTIDNLNIYNNTFIAAAGSNAGADGIVLPGIGYATDINIKNNIIVGFYRNSIRAVQFTAGCTIDRLNITNNVMYNNGASNVPDYSEFTPTNIVYTDYYYSDPLFVDFAALDLHLQNGSPAINAGIDVGLTTDYDDVAVANPPEIGAYEKV